MAGESSKRYLGDTGSSSCSKNEKIFQQWFDFMDKDDDGILTPTEALVAFHKSHVAHEVLDKALKLVNHEFKDCWNFKEFTDALKLISMLEDEKEVNADSLAKSDHQIKPPNLQGLDELIEEQKQKKLLKLKEVRNIEDSSTTLKPKKSPTLLKLASFVTPKRLNFEESYSKSKQVLDDVNSINDGLKILYQSKLKNLEKASGYQYFASLEMTNAEFDAKPIIMVLGQTSAGKTTFLNNLLQKDYFGSKVGDEATTDKFVAVMSGPKKCRVTGINAVTRPDLPFESLRTFKDTFLQKFEVIQMTNPNLRNFIFVDTPGVKSGQKFYKDTSYNYLGISKWFAERCRLIFILFDSRTLDFCPEFQEILASLRGQSHKVVVVLNKVDLVKNTELVKVVGSLLFGLGKVLDRSTSPTFLCCTLDGKPMKETVDPAFKLVFEEDNEKIRSILNEVAQDASDMKIHDFIRRANNVVTHARIVVEIKRQMPKFFKDSLKTKRKIIRNLDSIFSKVQSEFDLSDGDLPDLDHYRVRLEKYDLAQLGSLDEEIEIVTGMINSDIPKIHAVVTDD